MIKKEHLKQAIDAISAKNAEVGYALDEMLGAGMIGVSDEQILGSDFAFMFQNEKVPVSRFVFIREGSVPIEQALLVKYGELAKKQEITARGVSDFQKAAHEVRLAGLRFMVSSEIDYALEKLNKLKKSQKSREAFYKHAASLLASVKNQDSFFVSQKPDNPESLFTGAVDAGTPAIFARFPFCMGFLIQAAEFRLEFFHVRFLLNCLINGMDRNLFACIVDGRVAGMIYLVLKQRMFANSLEIKYIATRRGAKDEQYAMMGPVPRGAGTFLVAGAWLLWKAEKIRATEIVLDSEIQARSFYETTGFTARGLSEYALTSPKGRLAKSIVFMANNCPDLQPDAVEAVCVVIRKQVLRLKKRLGKKKDIADRNAAADAVRQALDPEARPEFAKAALQVLKQKHKKIPEAGELLALASQSGFL